MDDFNINTLRQSTNELCSRLLNIITPHIIEGFQSIFNESLKICKENKEKNKYLMTFQNLLCRIPKWNTNIIKQETERIIEKSGCGYLEDLVTCVHIIHLKTLTAIRVGNKQKKIDISISKLDDFIHKIYILVARKTYVNIYLFEQDINALQIQRNNREFEIIVNECILNAIRESIPTEQIIKAYMDESVEIEEEIIIENIPNEELQHIKNDNEINNNNNNIRTTEDIPKEIDNEDIKTNTPISVIKNIDEEPVINRLSFNDIDNILNEDNTISTENSPKDLQTLEEISKEKFMNRKLEEEKEKDTEDRIKILSDEFSIDDLGIHDLNETKNTNDNSLDLFDEIISL